MCLGTFTPSHLGVAARGAGDGAEQIEHTNCLKYSALKSKYLFLPVAIESSAVLGPKSFSFLHDLGSNLMSVSIIKSYSV